MGARRIRREQRQADMAESRHRNGVLKTKERARRQARMKAALKAGKMPYPRLIMTWLSAHLHKPATQITDADVKKLLQA